MKSLIFLFILLPLCLFAQTNSYHTDYLYVADGATGVTTESDLGMSTIGRAVTATLFVSPNGDDTDGSTWAKAYTTIQGALAVASTDADDLTLILISPHDTNYDINTTGAQLIQATTF